MPNDQNSVFGTFTEHADDIGGGAVCKHTRYLGGQVKRVAEDASGLTCAVLGAGEDHVGPIGYEGHIPFCRNCGEVLDEGSVTVPGDRTVEVRGTEA